MSQKLRFSIMGSEPIKFRSKMPNFELKSQCLGQGMPRRGDFDDTAIHIADAPTIKP